MESTSETVKASRIRIQAREVKSLTWCNGALADWLGGTRLFHLDGRTERAPFYWAFSFNAAVATEDGEFAVVYQRFGTKAVVLRNGKIIRELNRSYYFAETYEYPICLVRDPNGRALILHCPDDYCRLDIEEAESGTILTCGARKPEDFFHSRLMVNPRGSRLLSAGWFWHPLDAVAHYDLRVALENPAHLDSAGSCVPNTGEITVAEAGSACWQTTDRILIGGVDEEGEPVEANLDRSLRLNARGIAICDVVEGKYTHSINLDDPPGTMMPIGESHVISFYKHPKLISLADGQILARWDDLESGDQLSSIASERKFYPLALDPKHSRFAVADSEGITVVTIDAIG